MGAEEVFPGFFAIVFPAEDGGEGEEDNALQPSAHPEELSEADRAAVKENLRKKILGK